MGFGVIFGFLAALFTARNVYSANTQDAYVINQVLQQISRGNSSFADLRPRTACETKVTKPAAKSSVSCANMTTREIATKCVADKTKLEPQQIKTSRDLPCSGLRRYLIVGPRLVQRLDGDYTIGIEAGTVSISQRVRFTGLEKSGSKRQSFITSLENAIPRIQEFWRRQGVTLDLQYEVTSHNSKPKWPAPEVHVDFKKKRTNSRNWHIGEYHSEPDEFLNVAVHELAHLLAFPDNYVDESHFCKQTYQLRNSSLTKTFACPDRNDMCNDVMDGGTGMKMASATFAPRDFYRLIEPICPSICEFSSSDEKIIQDALYTRIGVETYLKITDDSMGELAAELELQFPAGKEEAFQGAKVVTQRRFLSDEEIRKIAMKALSLPNSVFRGEPSLGSDLDQLTDLLRSFSKASDAKAYFTTTNRLPGEINHWKEKIAAYTSARTPIDPDTQKEFVSWMLQSSRDMGAEHRRILALRDLQSVVRSSPE